MPIEIRPYRPDVAAQPQAGTFDPSQFFSDELSSAPPSATSSFDPRDNFDDRKTDAEAISHSMTNIPAIGSFAEGAASGATFGFAPVISGVRSAGMSTLPNDVQEAIKTHGHEPVLGSLIAGLGRLGYENLIAPALGINTDKYGTDAYKKSRDTAEAERMAAEEQHRGYYLGGQLAGSIAAPIGASVSAPTAAARIGQGLGIGAIGGGLYGSGEAASKGMSAEEIAQEGIRGAETGAPFGLIGAAGGEIIGKGASKVASIVRGQKNVNAEAGRIVYNALKSDYERFGPSVGPEEVRAGDAAGLVRYMMDTGGERTRAVLKSSYNTSPEARQVIDDVVKQRLAEQPMRVANFIRNMTGGGNAYDDLQTIQSAARKASGPAYARAYTVGNGPISSPELDRLSSAPSVASALQNTKAKWRDWQVVDRIGQPEPPISPNIQHWDYAVRDIADAAKKARDSGARGEAARLGGLERQLKAELDKIVPEYGQARRGAAAFFGAENALEAGQNFVMSNANMHEAATALGKMDAAERELFARGFASDLANKIEKTSFDGGVLRSAFVNNGPARQKIYMALGPDRARQLEALLRIEKVSDESRKALGNSSTFRQAVEGGLATSGALAAYEGLKEHELDFKSLITAALLGGAARHGIKKIDESVARRVGEMLVSNNPSVLNKGIKVVTGSPVMLDALRLATSGGARIAAHDIGPTNAAALGTATLERMISGPEQPEHRTGNQDNIYDNLPQQ